MSLVKTILSSEIPTSCRIIARFFIASRVDGPWNVGVKKKRRKKREKEKKEREEERKKGTWIGQSKHGASWPARGVIHPVIRPEIKIYPIKNSKYLFRLMAVPWITLLIPGLSGWLTDKGTKILRKQILRFQRGLYKTGKIIYGHGFMFLCGLASRNKIVTTSGLPCRRNYDL